MQTNNAKVHSSEAIPSVVGCPKCGSKDWGYCGVIIYWKNDLADSICNGCGQRFVSRYGIDFSWKGIISEAQDIALSYVRGYQKNSSITIKDLDEVKQIIDAYMESLKTPVIASQ